MIRYYVFFFSVFFWAISLVCTILPGNGLQVDVEYRANGGEFLDIYLNEKAELLHRLLATERNWKHYVFDISDVNERIDSLRVDGPKTPGAVGEIRGVTISQRGNILFHFKGEDFSRWRQSDMKTEVVNGVFKMTATTNDPRMVSEPIVIPINRYLFHWYWYKSIVAKNSLFFALVFLSLTALIASVPALGRTSLNSFSAAVISLALFVGFCVYRIKWPDPHADAPFLPEAFALMGANVQNQERAYKAVLLFAVPFCGLVVLIFKDLYSRLLRVVDAVPRLFQCLSLLPIAVIIAIGLRSFQKWSTWFFANTGVFLFCSVAGILFSYFRFEKAPRWIERLLSSLSLAYAGYFLVSGLFTAPILEVSERYFQVIETHYAVLVGTSARLAKGLVPFVDVKLWYGMLYPTVVAIFEKHFGTLSMGQYMHVIQFMQVLFFLAAFASYSLWPARVRNFRFLAPLFLLPWISNNGVAIFFPNHSAWRSLNLALGVLLLVLIEVKKIRRAAPILGVASGLYILSNLETGIAVSAGSVMFLLTRMRGKAFIQKVREFGQLGLGLLLMILIVGVIYRVALGQFPFTQAALRSYNVVSAAAGGYGGVLVRPFSLEFVCGMAILIHMLGVYFSAATVWARMPLSSLGRLRVSVATIVLVWFVYFVHRPDNFWYLWTILFLYSFFISDHLDGFRLLGQFLISRLPHKRLVQSVLLAVCFAFIFGPIVFQSNQLEMRNILDQWGHLSNPGLTEVSGVRIPNAIAQPLLEKVRFLQTEHQRVPTVHFTMNPFTVPQLSGIYPRIPARDIMDDVAKREDFDFLVSRVLEIAPSELLYESPEMVMAMDRPHFELFERLKERLACFYQLKGSASGWEIWERTADSCKLSSLHLYGSLMAREVPWRSFRLINQ